MHTWGLGFAWIPLFGSLLFIVVIWSIFWKGLALWHSAQRGQSWWFLIMLIINTAGILEIIYLFAVAKLHVHDFFRNNSRRLQDDMK